MGKNEAAPAAHEVSAARGKSRERAPDRTGVRKRGEKEKKRRAALRWRVRARAARRDERRAAGGGGARLPPRAPPRARAREASNQRGLSRGRFTAVERLSDGRRGRELRAVRNMIRGLARGVHSPVVARGARVRLCSTRTQEESAGLARGCRIFPGIRIPP